MKKILTCCVATATLMVGGCTLLSPLPVMKQDRYCVAADGTNNMAKAPLRIAVMQVDGRDPYRRDRIVYSESRYSFSTYANAVWAQNPCDMLSAEMVTFFSRRFQYATLMPRVYKTSVDTIVSLYVDAFDQQFRDGKWQATFRAKYELLSGAGDTLLVGAWFERIVPLQNQDLAAYVAAQNASVVELFDELERVIRLHVQRAPDTFEQQ